MLPHVLTAPTAIRHYPFKPQVYRLVKYQWLNLLVCVWKPPCLLLCVLTPSNLLLSCVLTPSNPLLPHYCSHPQQPSWCNRFLFFFFSFLFFLFFFFSFFPPSSQHIQYPPSELLQLLRCLWKPRCPHTWPKCSPQTSLQMTLLVRSRRWWSLPQPLNSTCLFPKYRCARLSLHICLCLCVQIIHSRHWCGFSLAAPFAYNVPYCQSRSACFAWVCVFVGSQQLALPRLLLMLRSLHAL